MSDDLIWDALKLIIEWACILSVVLTMHPWWRPLPPKEK